MFITKVCILLALNLLAIRCIWGFLAELLYTYKFYLNKEKQEGVVIGVKTKLGDEYEPDWHAVIIQYTAVDGKDYVIETEDFGFLIPEEGAKMLVCYEKEDPFNVIINPERIIWWKYGQIAFSLIIVTWLDVVCVV